MATLEQNDGLEFVIKNEKKKWQESERLRTVIMNKAIESRNRFAAQMSDMSGLERLRLECLTVGLNDQISNAEGIFRSA